MTWWLWIFLGLVLLGVEILTPGGFYILFFGLGALVVGALSGLHIVEVEWLQWLLFSALSIVSLMIFRGPLRRVTKITDAGGPAVDTLIGKTGLAVEDIAPDAIGKLELHGTMWSARNAGTTVVAKGQRGLVSKVEGLTLWIKGE